MKQVESFLIEGEEFVNLKKRLEDFIHPNTNQKAQSRDEAEKPEAATEEVSSQEATMGLPLCEEHNPWYQLAWSEYTISVANELGTGPLSAFLRRLGGLKPLEGYTRVPWNCVRNSLETCRDPQIDTWHFLGMWSRDFRRHKGPNITFSI